MVTGTGAAVFGSTSTDGELVIPADNWTPGVKTNHKTDSGPDHSGPLSLSGPRLAAIRFVIGWCRLEAFLRGCRRHQEIVIAARGELHLVERQCDILLAKADTHDHGRDLAVPIKDDVVHVTDRSSAAHALMALRHPYGRFVLHLRRTVILCNGGDYHKRC